MYTISYSRFCTVIMFVNMSWKYVIKRKEKLIQKVIDLFSQPFQITFLLQNFSSWYSSSQTKFATLVIQLILDKKNIVSTKKTVCSFDPQALVSFLILSWMKSIRVSFTPTTKVWISGICCTLVLWLSSQDASL